MFRAILLIAMSVLGSTSAFANGGPRPSPSDPQWTIPDIHLKAQVSKLKRELIGVGQLLRRL